MAGEEALAMGFPLVGFGQQAAERHSGGLAKPGVQGERDPWSSTPGGCHRSSKRMPAAQIVGSSGICYM